ncbi:unnamed protein product, partial [marine sediment metagenome]
MNHQESKLSRRKFMGSLAGLGASVAISCESSGKEKKGPEFTGPLTREK